MADKDEIILITVDVNSESSEKKTKRLRTELDLLKATKAELIKANKASQISEDQFATALEQTEKQLKETTAALAESTKAEELARKIRTAAKGSMDQYRATIELLTPAYNAMGKAERESAAGKAMQKHIREITEEMKKEEKALGDNSRRIGDNLAKAEQSFGLFGGTIGSLKDKLSSAKEGLGAMKLGLTGLKGAIAATGIGLLLLALSGLYTILTRTQGGMDKMSQITAAAGAVFTVLINRGVKLAEALSNVFASPRKAYQLFKETFSGVGEEIAQVAAAATATELASQNLRREERKLNVDREKSRAQIEELKKLSEDVTKSEAVRLKAAQDGSNLEQGLLKRQIDLEKRRIDILDAEAKRNGNKDEDLDKVAEAKQRLYQFEADSLGKQTELKNKENELQKASDQNRFAALIALDEERLAYALSNEEQIVEGVLRIREDEYAVRRQLLKNQEKYELAALVEGSNQEAAIKAKFRVEEAALNVREADEINRRAIEIQLAGLEQQIVNLREHSVERQILEQQASELRQDLEQQEIFRTVTNLEELNAKLKALDEKRKADRKKTNDEITQEGLKQDGELIKARLAQSAAGSKEELDAQLADLENQKKAELAAAGDSAEAIYRIELEYERRKADLRRSFFRAKVDEYTGYALQATDVFTKIIEAEFQAQSQALDKQQKASLDNALLTSDQRAAIEKDFQQKKAALELEAAKKRKKIATVENIINTAKSITIAAGNPFPLNVIQIALAAATGIAQQAVIESQQFAVGGVPREAKRRRYQGVVSGPGTTTSDSIPADLSVRESVMNAQTTDKYYDELSAMNVDGGGVPFPGAKPVDIRSFLADVRAKGIADAQTAPRPTYVTAAMLGQSSPFASTVGGVDPQVLADLVGEQFRQAIAQMPAPRIVVSDYERVANQVKVLQHSANT
ncbi:hypothetical protein [uncultured Fibrella sp.]|uniref:hypothetical protein n=1 Tax=uncultured Fibrella sp. TaxID=1284596 RepID=UPI0035C9E885